MKFATVGDNCIDHYIQTQNKYPGGNPVNVAVYIKRLGGQSSYTGLVGMDDFGSIIMDSLKKKGVDISHLKRVEGATAVTEVTIENGDRVFGEYKEGVLKGFKLTKDDIEFLASHDIVISGIWGMIEGDLDKIKQTNTPIAFDFSDQYNHEIVDKALPYVDYAFFAYDGDDLNYIKNYMITAYSKGPQLVICTLGEKGSIAYDGTDFISSDIVKCKVIDTMGAGDSYIAGFLYSYLREKDIKKAMQRGSENSAVTLAYSGSW